MAPILMTRSGRLLAEDGADDDREGVGGDHADGAADPGAEPALLRGQGDGGEHGLVAELGEEEGDADGDDRRAGAAARLVGLVVGELVAAQGPGGEDEEGDAGDDRDDVPAVGERVADRVRRSPTEARWTIAVATVMPMRTSRTR